MEIRGSFICRRISDRGDGWRCGWIARRWTGARFRNCCGAVTNRWRRRSWCVSSSREYPWLDDFALDDFTNNREADAAEPISPVIPFPAGSRQNEEWTLAQTSGTLIERDEMSCER